MEKKIKAESYFWGETEIDMSTYKHTDTQGEKNA